MLSPEGKKISVRGPGNGKASAEKKAISQFLCRFFTGERLYSTSIDIVIYIRYIYHHISNIDSHFLARYMALPFGTC